MKHLNIQGIGWGLMLSCLMISCNSLAISVEETVQKATEEVITLKGEEGSHFETLPIDVPTLLKLVYDRNLDIAISEAQVEQAKGYFYQAMGGLLPSVRSTSYVEKLRGGEIFVGPVPFDVDRVTYQPRLSADYELSLGGKVLYDISATQLQLKRLRIARNQTTQNALLEALSQYYILVRNTANVEVAWQALREADAQVKYNEARFRAGFGTNLEVMQAKTLQAERKNDVLKAENEKVNAAVTLSSMLDLPFTLYLETDVKQVDPVTFVDEIITLEQLMTIAMENRQDIRELTLAIREAKARFGSARADLFPSVFVSAYRRGVGPTLESLQETQQMFASISFDMLQNMGLEAVSNMKIAKAQIKESILNKEKQLNEIQKNISKAYQDSNLYRAQLEVAKQKVQSAQEAYRIAGARLKMGVGLNIEVIQAQKDLTDARFEYENAAMEYNNAQVKLLFETGQLNPHRILSEIAQEQQALSILPAPPLPSQAATH